MYYMVTFMHVFCEIVPHLLSDFIVYLLLDLVNGYLCYIGKQIHLIFCTVLSLKAKIAGSSMHTKNACLKARPKNIVWTENSFRRWSGQSPFSFKTGDGAWRVKNSDTKDNIQKCWKKGSIEKSSVIIKNGRNDVIGWG